MIHTFEQKRNLVVRIKPCFFYFFCHTQAAETITKLVTQSSLPTCGSHAKDEFIQAKIAFYKQVPEISRKPYIKRLKNMDSSKGYFLI